MGKKKGKSTPKLAAKIDALAKLGAKRKAAIEKKARAAIALIKSKKDEIANDFYVIGKALLALDDKAVVAVLGHPSFGALCQIELGMSSAQAQRLMNVAKSFSKREAADLTASKATAIVDLAGAIGGKTTAKGLLARGTVDVPGVGAIDVKSADAATLDRAARAAREKDAHKTTHGVSLTSADKQLVAHMRAALKRANVKAAEIEGIAASVATGGRFRISGYLRDLHAICEALVATKA